MPNIGHGNYLIFRCLNFGQHSVSLHCEASEIMKWEKRFEGKKVRLLASTQDYVAFIWYSNDFGIHNLEIYQIETGETVFSTTVTTR